MKQLLKYVNREGETIYIEVSESAETIKPKRGMRDVGSIRERAEKIITISNSTFEKAVESVCHMGQVVVDKVKLIQPQKATVEFGITFSAEAGAIITVGGEANFKITLTWEGDGKTNSLK